MLDHFKNIGNICCVDMKRSGLQNRVSKFTPKKFFEIDTRGQCYKTLFVRDSRIFVISYSVCETMLEKFARDKYSSLLRKSVNQSRKKFYNIGCRRGGSSIIWRNVCRETLHLDGLKLLKNGLFYNTWILKLE